MIYFLLFLIDLAGFPQTSKRILSQTVGTSAYQVVTSRDVKASVILNQVLKNTTPENYQELSADDVSRTLFEFAIFRESESLSAVKLSDSELQQLVGDIKPALLKRSDFKALEATDTELKSWVLRKKVAMTYFDLKVNSLLGIVTDEEVQNYFDRNRIKFGSTSLETQKDSIKAFLQKENQKQKIEDWVSALKLKYQVRNDINKKGPL